MLHYGYVTIALPIILALKNRYQQKQQQQQQNNSRESQFLTEFASWLRGEINGYKVCACRSKGCVFMHQFKFRKNFRRPNGRILSTYVHNIFVNRAATFKLVYSSWCTVFLSFLQQYPINYKISIAYWCSIYSPDDFAIQLLLLFVDEHQAPKSHTLVCYLKSMRNISSR